MKNIFVVNYIKSLSKDEKNQEALIKILSNILLKQEDINLFIKENESKIIHIRDWMSSIVINNEKLKIPRVLYNIIFYP